MKKTLLALIALIAGVFILYFPSLGFDFAWLDQAEILGGQLIIQNWTELQQAFVWDDGNHSLYHRPIYNLVHSLDFGLWGTDPQGYHLTNILFHLCNTTLLFAFLRRLETSQWLAFGITALWAILPIHAPVVGLIHSKGDLVSTFFLLSSAVLLVQPTAAKRIISSICLLLALLTKEVALAGIALIAIWKVQEHGKSLVKEHLTWIVPLLLYAGLRLSSFGSEASEESLFDIHRLLTFPLVYGSYFWESLPGIRLGISDTVWAWNGRSTISLIVGVTQLIAAVTLQVWLWRRAPDARKYILLFNVLLIPVSQLIPTLHFRADRFLYLASVGWIGIWAYTILHWTNKFVWLKYIPVVIGLWFGLRVWMELPNYENNETLFVSVLDREPLNREARGYMGLIASENGDDSRAIFHLSKALNGNPQLYSYVDRNIARANLATSQMRLMQYEAALQNFLNVSNATGEPVELDFNIGLCYKMLGKPKEAYDRMIRYQRKYPEDIQVMEKLVEIYVDMGRRGKAIEEINRILKINPRHPHVASLKQALIDLQQQR